MKKYTIKATALSPIHIGTGESYEPTNFVIDDGYLYEFDEVSFYRDLPEKEKIRFNEIVSKKGFEALFALHGFIKQHKEVAKKVKKLKVQVSKGFAKEYEKKIGKVVQLEGKEKRKVFNNFAIERTIRGYKSHQVYIPGSSIKGAIDTALQEFIYKTNPNEYEKLIERAKPTSSIFKDLSISDSLPLKTYSYIGYALNKERFEDDTTGPKKPIEVIYSSDRTHAQFVFEIAIKRFEDTKNKDRFITMEKIIKSANQHYLTLFQQMFESYTVFENREQDDYTNEYFSDSFYEKYKDLKLSDNQFLLRVGKHSGARAVTIEGMRKIRVKESGGGRRRKPTRWKFYDQETTTWFFGTSEDATMNLLPFGWLLCEIEEEKAL